jgi:hypothetical protein
MRHAKPNERRYCVALYELGTPIKIMVYLIGRPPQTLARWLRASGVARRRFR